MAALEVYCLDASSCAGLNEDCPAQGQQPGSRLAFQRRLLGCLSQAALAARPAAARAAEVALVASHNGKASVVLPPGPRAALLPALERLPAGGDCAPAAALKLALLLARRAPSAHITAFLASPCSLGLAEAEDLRGRMEAAEGASLDLVVLAPPHELGAGTVEALARLAACPGNQGAVARAEEQQQEEEEQPGSPGGSLDQIPWGEDEEDEGTAWAAGALWQPGPGRPAGSSGSSSSAAGRCRVVWAPPQQLQHQQQQQQQQLGSLEGSSSGEGGEAWQYMEALLEQLERRGGSGASAWPAAGPSTIGHTSSSGGSSVLQRGAPARIRRAPAAYDALRRPRAPLLAARSGVHQPALCRHESLNWLGHLSIDGMMRPWLPTYASLKARAQRATGQPGGAGVAAALVAGDQCFLQVCPIPRWRTLLRVSAGLMQSTPVGPASGVPEHTRPLGIRPSHGQLSRAAHNSASAFAELSARLLQGLEALQLDERLDRGEQGGQRSSPSSTTSLRPSSTAPLAACSLSWQQQQEQRQLLCDPVDSSGPPCAAAAVRLSPDPRRGTLRLLQGVKEPSQFKLVWSPDEPAEGSTAHKQHQQEPFHMFHAPASGPGGGTAGGLLSSLLGVGGGGGAGSANSAPSSSSSEPLLHQGTEFWESRARFEVEVPLVGPGGLDVEGEDAAQDGYGLPSGSESGSQLRGEVAPNGAQLLVVSAPGSGAALRAEQPAAFWLQQRWGLGCLLGGAADGGALCPGAQVGAAAAATVVLGLLRRPPPVDLRQLRRDVKEGLLKVTPVNVGPLPSRLLQDLVNTRASIMRSMGVENMDSMHGQPAARGASGGSGTGPHSSSSGGSLSAGGAGAGPGGGGVKPAGGDEAAAAVAGAGGVSKRRRAGGEGGGEGGQGGLELHRRAVLSLLQGRLLGSGSEGGRAGEPAGMPATRAAVSTRDDSPEMASPAASGQRQQGEEAGEGETVEAGGLHVPGAVGGPLQGPGAAAAAEGAPGSMGALSAGSSTPFGTPTPYSTPMHILPAGGLVGGPAQHVRAGCSGGEECPAVPGPAAHSVAEEGAGVGVPAGVVVSEQPHQEPGVRRAV